ncbi:MAG: hypothetical protein PHX75_03550 [Candidatus Methanomethylophilaceae archaeon]|nr:hypothetical protein [Candidatus Methanomethylophilaceae archaeon]
MHEDHDDHDHDDHDHDDPTIEGSRLHLEIHRAVDELGKYAIELRIKSQRRIPKKDILGFIEDLMRTATRNCLDHGADLVGHVKSILISEDGSIMSSIVDYDVPTKFKDDLQSDMIYEAILTLHVIVHGIWDDVIRDHTKEALPGVAKKWKIPYEIIADYFDLEKSIEHHL